MAFKQKTFIDHNLPTPEEALTQQKLPVVLVLENIRSGNNVGSILRTADTFAIQKVYLVGYTPAPPHREILKTSLGAEMSVSWQKVETIEEVVGLLRDDNYHISALEQTNDSIVVSDFDFTDKQPLAVILGNEVKGVSTDALAVVDSVIEIPQMGAKQSLNVSVATGVVCYQALTKLSTLAD